jgi:competence protein CoiA
MLFAIVDNKKVEASPQTTGICPLCEQPVFSKCGEVNVWHWAHYNNKNCDSWYEPETEWHKAWKLVFGKENSEVIICEGGVKHIADIRTKENVIIELQNSPIQKPVIWERETFYGEQMLWIMNGNHFKHKFSISLFRSAALDADDEYDRLHNPLSSHYGIPLKNKGQLSFSWTNAHRSWEECRRHVFIDFGSDSLFHVTEGMGSKKGKGIFVTKERFITKYGGNLQLLPTLYFE